MQWPSNWWICVWRAWDATPIDVLIIVCSLRWWDNPSGCFLSVRNRYTLINSRVAQNVFAATVNGTQKGKICMAKKTSFLEIMGNNGTLQL